MSTAKSEFYKRQAYKKRNHTTDRSHGQPAVELTWSSKVANMLALLAEMKGTCAIMLVTLEFRVFVMPLLTGFMLY